MMVEGRVCQRRSKTWTGFCGNTRGCDSQCKRWERASHGACHAQFPGAITCLIELEQLTYTSDCYSFMVTISILELTNYQVTIKVTG
ncbi:unnamed protein product [Brassica napus]|uniref:(rape) hypothetical protein n=1 Tax=Brassica napus TaxID=3708 RepID=A0A817AIJ4_BRANA|nr:unnamed protein product [Brassica napus]